MTITDITDAADARLRQAIARINSQPTTGVPDAAIALGVSRTAVYEAVKAGKLPAVKVMSRVRIPSKWLREQLMLDED